MTAAFRLFGALLAASAVFALAPSAHAATTPTKSPAPVSRSVDLSKPALRAAAKKLNLDKRPLARAAGYSPISIGFDFWTASTRVVIDRNLGCLIARGDPVANALINAFTPYPFNYLVNALVQPYRYVFNNLMGTQGIELRINVLGIPTYFGPSGNYQRCY